MAEYRKFGRAAAVKILKHNCRQSLLTAEQYSELEMKRENIDSNRTHLNYDLAEADRRIIGEDGTERTETALEKYSRLFSEIESETNSKFIEYTRKNRITGEPEKIKKPLTLRTDAVSLCGWVVTAPKDLPPDEEAQFFQITYDFIADKYGRENIIAANVHHDEVTPHIHVTFMPIVKDKKHGGNKLGANGMETPRSLSRFHQQLSKVMETALGHKVGILNGATVGGNLSITQLKLQDALKKLVETEMKITNANAQKDIQDLLEKVAPALIALDKTLENRSFFKKNPEKQFKQVVAIVREVTSAMQEIRDFPRRLDEMGISASEQLDAVMQQAMITAKQTEERLKTWEKRLKTKDEEMYAEIDQLLKEMQQERMALNADKDAFERAKENLIASGVQQALMRSEKRAACMQVSDAWLKRTGGIFDRNTNTYIEKENDHNESENVSTDNGGYRTQKQKPALRHRQVHGEN